MSATASLSLASHRWPGPSLPPEAWLHPGPLLQAPSPGGPWDLLSLGPYPCPKPERHPSQRDPGPLAIRNGSGEFLWWLSGLRTQLISLRIRVQSLACLSRLRIRCGCGCSAGWQLQLLRFRTSLGTSLCRRCGLKKKRKKERRGGRQRRDGAGWSCVDDGCS